MAKDPERKPPLLAVSDGPVTEEEVIRKRAYELYIDRGMEDGHDLEDWFRAEEELASRRSQSAAA
ncbi:MAG TPA: DUF2934 domain-containing protein [Terriglobales bacterium]|nr:DUF2934 domain-containing protein [Terriglobales bacterium]